MIRHVYVDVYVDVDVPYFRLTQERMGTQLISLTPVLNPYTIDAPPTQHLRGCQRLGSLPNHTHNPLTTHLLHLFGVGQVFQFSRRADVFIAPRDYSYFLQFYARHVLPIADTYAHGLPAGHSITRNLCVPI